LSLRLPFPASSIVSSQNELALRKRRLRDPGFEPATDPVVTTPRVQISTLWHQLTA
jgi:hypothetical protein